MAGLGSSCKIAQTGVALTESGSDDHVWQHELGQFLFVPEAGLEPAHL